MDNIQLIHGNCLEILPTLEADYKYHRLAQTRLKQKDQEYVPPSPELPLLVAINGE